MEELLYVCSSMYMIRHSFITTPWSTEVVQGKVIPPTVRVYGWIQDLPPTRPCFRSENIRKYLNELHNSADFHCMKFEEIFI